MLFDFYLSTYITHLPLHVVFFFLKAINILIIVILYSLCDNFNICVISEDGTEDDLSLQTVFSCLLACSKCWISLSSNRD